MEVVGLRFQVWVSMALAALSGYGSEGTDEEEGAGNEAAPAVSAMAAFVAPLDDGSDDDADEDGGAGDVEMRPPPSGDGGAGSSTLLPSADDLLGGWTPAQAAPPPKRPPSSQQAASRAPARVGGHLVPPQVSSGKANLSTEDRESDRLSRAGGGRPTPQVAPPAKSTGKDVSWRAKEKRKREMGQQNAGKDWVQDEKRQLRHAGENYDA